MSESDLDAIAETLAERERARARLREAVAASRAKGRSWSTIAAVLRTSKQAARERFGP